MRMNLLAASLLLALSSSAMAGQIYKWVDAQGQTHFDAQPPQGQDVTKIAPAPAPPATAPKPAPATAPNAAQDAADTQVKKQVAEQEVKLKAFCDSSRTNLAQLRNNPRVRENVEGELRRMTEEQRQTRITEMEKTIKQYCQ